MSVRNIADSGVVNIPFGGSPQPWVRNPSWVAMPSVTNTEQKFVALFAVYPSGNLVAFTAAGNYTVDWGDGTTQNFTSGTTAEREINYTAAALANTDAPVTLTDAGDLVGRTAHGYTNGMAVQFYNIVTTTGLTAGQTYFVINATANNFQVSLTAGGSAVALTGNGSATLLQFRQTLITVTPQAGQNLTSLNLQVRHSAAGTTTYTVNYLDAVLSAPNMTALFIGSASATASTINVRPVMMERCLILSMGSVGTGLGFLFNECRSLRVAQLQGLNGATDLNSMFNLCSSLTSLSLMDTSAVTSTASMFSSCSSLPSVPLFNTVAVTNMTSMFSGCRDLVSVPLLNTAAVTNMQSMFFGCSALITVPLFNTAAVTNMTSMFQGCTALTSVPRLNTAVATNMTSMFSGCTALITVPPFNTALVTNMTQMFNGCSALTAVPLFNTAAVTNMFLMFANCQALTSVPPFNTAAVTNMQQMFQGCINITSVPLFNTAAVSNASSMFTGCVSLVSVPLFNWASGLGVNLSSMFNGCSALKIVPAFSTSVVNNMSGMFNNCSSLTTIPAFTGSGSSSSAFYTNIFQNCFALARSEVTNFRFSHSYANCKLSAAELDAIYTRLPTVTGQTITVTGNYGTAGDNPAIATAKGWTVTG